MYVFRGVQYIGTQNLDFIKDILQDDTEAESAVTYGEDVIGDWAGSSAAGTEKPTAYGWSASTDKIPWNTAGGGGGVRYETATHNVENDNAYTGRFMTIRWDGNEISNATYFYPVVLEANTNYDFSLLYEYWSNATSSRSMTIGISTSNNVSGIYDSQTFILLQRHKSYDLPVLFLPRKKPVLITLPFRTMGNVWHCRAIVEEFYLYK